MATPLQGPSPSQEENGVIMVESPPTSLFTSSSISTSKRVPEIALDLVKKSGNALGLPGLSEVARAAELMFRLKKSPEEQESQETALLARLAGILAALQNYPPSQQGVTEKFKREFLRIQDFIENDQKTKRRFSITLAEDRFEERERISDRIDRLAETLNLHNITKLLVSQEEVESRLRELTTCVQTLRRQLENQALDKNYKTVSGDQIYDQKALGTYDIYDITVNGHRHFLSLESCKLLDIQVTKTAAVVRVTCNDGQLNGVRVLRKSYNSHNQDAATELAKRDLLPFSKICHPNVTEVKGVLKTGLGLIQGIVFSQGQMPYDIFLARTNDPAILANYLRDLIEVFSTKFRFPLSSGRMVIRVDHSGHVTVVPATDSKQGYFFWGNVTRPNRQYGTLDPAIEEIMNAWDTNEPYRPRNAALLSFLNTISSFYIGFTELDVIYAAQITGLGPKVHYVLIRSLNTPANACRAPDIGLYTEKDEQWETLEKDSDSNLELRFSCFVRENRVMDVQVNKSTIAYGWESYLVPAATTRIHLVEKSQETRIQIWETLQHAAMRLEQTARVDKNTLCIVTDIHLIVSLTHYLDQSCDNRCRVRELRSLNSRCRLGELAAVVLISPLTVELCR